MSAAMTTRRRTSAVKRARPRAVRTVRIGPLLTINEVAGTRAALDRMLAGGGARADARGLESIDTAGLQLLLAAARAAQERGLKLRLEGGQRLVRGAAEALGLAAQLTAAVELST